MLHYKSVLLGAIFIELHRASISDCQLDILINSTLRCMKKNEICAFKGVNLVGERGGLGILDTILNEKENVRHACPK